jgi:hypothetical protein
MKERLPVILNIYRDSLFGLGFYHTAIEYDEIEYGFGFHKECTTGVYDIKPMSYDEGRFVESITLGYIDRRSFFKVMERLKRVFTGQTYNILFKNCNHFTNNVCRVLFDRELPMKYSRFLSIGDTLRKIF